MAKSLPLQTLRTWGGKAEFRYSGCVGIGTNIEFGKNFSHKKPVSAASYSALLKTFAGREVPIGTSRTTPPSNSVGAWLISNVSPTALASYVGSILIQEKHAKVGSAPDRIQFRPYPS